MHQVLSFSVLDDVTDQVTNQSYTVFLSVKLHSVQRLLFNLDGLARIVLVLWQVEISTVLELQQDWDGVLL